MHKTKLSILQVESLEADPIPVIFVCVLAIQPMVWATSFSVMLETVENNSRALLMELQHSYPPSKIILQIRPSFCSVSLLLQTC